MKKLLFPLTLFSLALLLGSCRKCEDTLIDPEFDQYFTGFKKGSYWIYQNDFNSKLDSVYVIENSRMFSASKPTLFSIGGACGKESVAMIMEGFSFNAGQVGYYSTLAGFSISSFTLNSPSFPYYLSFLALSVLPIDTATINNVLYPKVVKIDCQCDPNGINRYEPLFTKAFFAKDIGLIYYEISEPLLNRVLHRYTLIRYNVNL